MKSTENKEKLLHEMKQLVSFKKLISRNVCREALEAEDYDGQQINNTIGGKLHLPFCLAQFKKRCRKQQIAIDQKCLKLRMCSDRDIKVMSS